MIDERLRRLLGEVSERAWVNMQEYASYRSSDADLWMPNEEIDLKPDQEAYYNQFDDWQVFLNSF